MCSEDLPTETGDSLQCLFSMLYLQQRCSVLTFVVFPKIEKKNQVS